MLQLAISPRSMRVWSSCFIAAICFAADRPVEAGVIPWMYDAIFGPVGSMHSRYGYSGMYGAGYAPAPYQVGFFGGPLYNPIPIGGSGMGYPAPAGGCSSCQTAMYAPGPAMGEFGACCSPCGAGGCGPGGCGPNGCGVAGGCDANVPAGTPTPLPESNPQVDSPTPRSEPIDPAAPRERAPAERTRPKTYNDDADFGAPPGGTDDAFQPPVTTPGTGSRRRSGTPAAPTETDQFDPADTSRGVNFPPADADEKTVPPKSSTTNRVPTDTPESTEGVETIRPHRAAPTLDAPVDDGADSEARTMPEMELRPTDRIPVALRRRSLVGTFRTPSIVRTNARPQGTWTREVPASAAELAQIAD